MPPARAIFYLLTAGAFGITACAVTGHAPALSFVVTFGALYIVVLLLGVMVLRLRVFVDALVHGPHGAKGIALTFDDGPHPETTMRTLDALDAAGAKATFFVIGRKAEKHPDVIKAILERGHSIGLHSYAHDRLFALRGAERWHDDLARGARVLERLTGSRPTLFRPPIGHTVPHSARIVRELGLRVIGWDVSGRDGVSADAKTVTERVLRDARDGCIVLLHDASERGTHEPAGVAALPAILDGLKAKGLGVVPLSEWM